MQKALWITPYPGDLDLEGAKYYSHLSREYVLNLTLDFYKDQTRFPLGDICITDHWYLKTASWGGRNFTNRKGGRNYIPGHWVHLLTLKEGKKSQGCKMVNYPFKYWYAIMTVVAGMRDITSVEKMLKHRQ